MIVLVSLVHNIGPNALCMYDIIARVTSRLRNELLYFVYRLLILYLNKTQIRVYP